MKHKIAIEETLRRVVEVEAENPSLAVCMAEDEYNREEHVLTGNDFIGVNITLAPEDKKAQEYLSDSAFRNYVERRFNGSSADIPLEDKARLAFGSLDNAIHDFLAALPLRCLAQHGQHGTGRPFLLQGSRGGLPGGQPQTLPADTMGPGLLPGKQPDPTGRNQLHRFQSWP